MNILPLVERELRVAARRRSTYRVRWWMAGLGLFLCLAAFSSRSPIGFLSGIGLGFPLLLGMIFFLVPLLQLRQVVETGQRILLVPAVLSLVWFGFVLAMPVGGLLPGP